MDGQKSQNKKFSLIPTHLDVSILNRDFFKLKMFIKNLNILQ